MPKITPAFVVLPVLAGGAVWLGACWWINQQVLTGVQDFAQNVQVDSGSKVTMTYSATPVWWKLGSVILSDIVITKSPTMTGGGQSRLVISGPLELRAVPWQDSVVLVAGNLPLRLEVAKDGPTRVLTGNFSGFEVGAKKGATAESGELRVTLQGAELGDAELVVRTGPTLVTVVDKGGENGKALSLKSGGIEFTDHALKAAATSSLTATMPVVLPEVKADKLTIANLEMAVTPSDLSLPEQDIMSLKASGLNVLNGTTLLGGMESFSMATRIVTKDEKLALFLNFQVGKVVSANASAEPLLHALSCSFGVSDIPLELAKSMEKGAVAMTELPAIQIEDYKGQLLSAGFSAQFGPCMVDSAQLKGRAEVEVGLLGNGVASVSGSAVANGPLVNMASIFLSGLPGVVDPSATDSLNIQLSSADGMLLVNGQPAMPLPTLNGAAVGSMDLMVDGAGAAGTFSPLGIVPVAEPVVVVTPTDKVKASDEKPKAAAVKPAEPKVVQDVAVSASEPDVSADEPAVVEEEPQPAPKPKKRKPKPAVDRYVVPGISDMSGR